MTFRLVLLTCLSILSSMALSLPILLVPNFVMAQTSTQQKSSLQKEQRSIKGQISNVKKEIAQQEARLDRANNDLRESEKAISSSNRTLKELNAQKKSLENDLQRLRSKQRIMSTQVSEAEDLVSILGQAQFMNVQRTPWRAAIEGANPNEITRMTAIFQYMAREQDRSLVNLAKQREENQRIIANTDKKQREVSQIQAAEQKNRANLEAEKRRQSSALDKLKKELNTQKKRYEQLVKNDQDLARVINRLDKQIAQQRAAQRKREQQSKKTTATAKANNIPAFQGKFAQLKGKLTLPTAGKIVAKFGQKRSGAASSLPWRGIMIQAKMGQNVLATAPGRVVFSDWMRGFGNLLIIDHGSNYLSVYANNETLYKSVGDTVKQGETIASVGQSGGEDSPGLYFELRYKGKPFDPTPWLKK